MKKTNNNQKSRNSKINLKDRKSRHGANNTGSAPLESESMSESIKDIVITEFFRPFRENRSFLLGLLYWTLGKSIFLIGFAVSLVLAENLMIDWGFWMTQSVFFGSIFWVSGCILWMHLNKIGIKWMGATLGISVGLGFVWAITLLSQPMWWLWTFSVVVSAWFSVTYIVQKIRFMLSANSKSSTAEALKNGEVPQEKSLFVKFWRIVGAPLIRGGE